MSLWAHTNTKPFLFYFVPLICHLCASQQKTFLQNRTGHRELWDLQGLRVHHLQVRGCIRIWKSDCLLLASHVSTESTELVSVHSYVHHAVTLSHIRSSVLWLGRIAILLCVTARTDMKHSEYGHSLHKHHCQF